MKRPCALATALLLAALLSASHAQAGVYVLFTPEALHNWEIHPLAEIPVYGGYVHAHEIHQTAMGQPIYKTNMLHAN